MVAEEFLKLVGEFKLATYVGVEDFADKLSFLFSFVLIILSMFVVTVKSYFFKPLSCYVTAPPSGSNFENYIENYCWVHGTITILPRESIPQTEDAWTAYDSKRINYYQWVPFILGLQCIMFYIPRIIWQLICYNKLGTNLESLVIEANDANSFPPVERKAKVENIARTIEDMIFQHRDYRNGEAAKLRRKLYNKCNFCVFSKHLGTWLVLSYFFIKVLYTVNVIGQLFLMKSFLQFNTSMPSFGYIILSNILDGKEWNQTGIFPRVTYCYVSLEHLGASNNYIGQCVLPINMLNEKIYIFLWFWILFVGIITIISIPMWFIRIGSLNIRSKFIKKLLMMHQNYERSHKLLITSFIKDFLRHDGIFLLRMILINAGDIITAEIVNRLFEIYTENYKDIDFHDYAAFIAPMNKGNALSNTRKLALSDNSFEKEPIENFI